MRKIAFALLALFALALVLPLRAQDDEDGKPPAKPHGRVLLITLDAFRPESYREDRFPMPNLRALAARGVQARKCVGVFPTLTYPSHTSIITGVHTGRHGVYSNTIFDGSKGDGGKRWFYERSYVKVPTILDVAHENKITTSAIHWPVTIGSQSIDWHIPEIFGSEFGKDHKAALRKLSTPGLYDEVWPEVDGHGEPAIDEATTGATVKIIEKYKPELMCVHLLQSDGAQHHAGREDPSVYEAFGNLDKHLGTIFKALETAGVASETNIIITGDHGMIDVHTAVKPNALLRELGFIQTDEKGKVTDWRAMANTGGAAAGIYAHDPADKATSEKIVAALKAICAEHYRGVFQVLDKDELDKLGAFPEAICALAGEPGFTMEASAKGDVLGPAHLRGNHGFLPSLDEVATGFVAAGPGIAQGRKIPVFRMIDIAPLAAHLLGMQMDCEGVLIPGILAPKGRQREDEH